MTSSASLAAPILVDDFSTGSGFQARVGDDFDGNHFIRFEDSLDSEHTVGGARWFRVQSCLRQGESFLPVNHEPALGTLQVGGTPESAWCEGVSLGYGGLDQELNLDLLLLPYRGLEVTVDSFDAGGPTFREASLEFSLATVYEDIIFPGTEFEKKVKRITQMWHTFAIEQTFANTVLFVPLSAFSAEAGQFSLADIDEITVSIGPGGPGAELAIRDIRFVVPEPATAGSLLMAILFSMVILRRGQLSHF